MPAPPIRPVLPPQPSDVPQEAPSGAGSDFRVGARSAGESTISREQLARLEDRLRILESAFVKNAVELRDQVARRLERIEHCIEGKVWGLREEFGEVAFDFTREESWNRSPQPPRLRDRVKKPDSPPGATVQVDGSAAVSLGEFNESLRATREQLEDLGRSIGELRVELSA